MILNLHVLVRSTHSQLQSLLRRRFGFHQDPTLLVKSLSKFYICFTFLSGENLKYKAFNTKLHKVNEQVIDIKIIALTLSCDYLANSVPSIFGYLDIAR